MGAPRAGLPLSPQFREPLGVSIIASCWLNPATIARAMSEVMRMRPVTTGMNSNSPSGFGRYMDVQNVKSWHWPTIGCSVM